MQKKIALCSYFPSTNCALSQSRFFVSSLPFRNHLFFFGSALDHDVYHCFFSWSLVKQFYQLAGKKTLPEFASQTFFRSQPKITTQNPKPYTFCCKDNFFPPENTYFHTLFVTLIPLTTITNRYDLSTAEGRGQVDPYQSTGFHRWCTESRSIRTFRYQSVTCWQRKKIGQRNVDCCCCCCCWWWVKT